MLNSVALFLFPLIGYALHLTQSQFGLWSALAIHDISSVVGATAKYGPQALMVGTTIKLARALWIVPVAFAVAIFKKSKTRIKWPWFILSFLPSCGCEHVFAGVRRGLSKTQRVGKNWVDSHSLSDWHWASRSTLKQVGVRPLLQRILLWAIVASTSLVFIRYGIIAI